MCPGFLFRNGEKKHLFLVIFSLGASEEILNNKKVVFHITILITFTFFKRNAKDFTLQ